MVISWAKNLQVGVMSNKIGCSWRLEERLVFLKNLISSHPAVNFSHVLRKANQLADKLANEGVRQRREFEGVLWGNHVTQSLREWEKAARKDLPDAGAEGRSVTRI